MHQMLGDDKLFFIKETNDQIILEAKLIKQLIIIPKNDIQDDDIPF